MHLGTDSARSPHDAHLVHPFRFLYRNIILLQITMSYLNENGKRPVSATKIRLPKSPEQGPPWIDHGHSRIFPSSNQSDPKSIGSQGNFSKAQARINQIQEAEQMREWVSKEDDFMLQQTKKKARIRIKEGRSQTIDKLIVTLGAAEMTEDRLEEEEEEEEEEMIEGQAVDPVSLIENLDLQEIKDLTKSIASFVFLEKRSSSRKLWKVLVVSSILCSCLTISTGFTSLV